MDPSQLHRRLHKGERVLEKLGLAEELVGVQDKLEYVNRTVCSLFDWEVSRVCFGQAMNRVRGKYVLASPSAVGLK